MPGWGILRYNTNIEVQRNFFWVWNLTWGIFLDQKCMLFTLTFHVLWFNRHCEGIPDSVKTRTWPENYWSCVWSTNRQAIQGTKSTLETNDFPDIWCLLRKHPMKSELLVVNGLYCGSVGQALAGFLGAGSGGLNTSSHHHWWAICFLRSSAF